MILCELNVINLRTCKRSNSSSLDVWSKVRIILSVVELIVHVISSYHWISTRIFSKINPFGFDVCLSHSFLAGSFGTFGDSDGYDDSFGLRDLWAESEPHHPPLGEEKGTHPPGPSHPIRSSVVYFLICVSDWQWNIKRNSSVKLSHE